MDYKISGKTQNILTLPFHDFYVLSISHFWHVFENKCEAIALGSVDHQREGTQKIIFHIYVTFDLWWLYINVDL